jgi:hypothetical protein
MIIALAITGIARSEVSSTFARVAVDEQQQPTALQLAIVTYVPQDGDRDFSVDLVSAIHPGESCLTLSSE